MIFDVKETCLFVQILCVGYFCLFVCLLACLFVCLLVFVCSLSCSKIQNFYKYPFSDTNYIKY